MWVLLTEVISDHVTETEDFFGIAPLIDEKKSSHDIAMAGRRKSVPERVRARILLLQADLQKGGQAEARMGKASDSANLGTLADMLLPWEGAIQYAKDPWNRRESIARVISVSEPIILGSGKKSSLNKGDGS
jgi:hypothetical protein